MRANPAVRRVTETALAALAHEIRTPLTGILALADLLATGDLPARERLWVASIKGAAEHLSALTSIVCDAVRADVAGLDLRQDRFSPRVLAEALGLSLSARAKTSGLAARITIGRNVPDSAIGDPTRLRAALENLIDNAVKFTARGEVALTVSARPAARRRTTLNFIVSDSGIGLTAAEIKKLSRPFTQANIDIASRYGGTGLGLALVKRIAKTMGGDLRIKSQAGKGSTFELIVTVDSSARAAAARPSGKRSVSSTVPPLRILCAEDNPYGRVVLSAILGEFGHSFDFVTSGDEAVLAVERGDFDAVLMDVALTGLDGFEATRRIRALTGPARQVAVIGISAFGSEQNVAKAIDAGMNDYLVKPVSPQALADALAKSRQP